MLGQLASVTGSHALIALLHTVIARIIRRDGLELPAQSFGEDDRMRALLVGFQIHVVKRLNPQ